MRRWSTIIRRGSKAKQAAESRQAARHTCVLCKPGLLRPSAGLAALPCDENVTGRRAIPSSCNQRLSLVPLPTKGRFPISAQELTEVMTKKTLMGATALRTFAAGGFAEGKFGFLEVLDAQRALSDARGQLNDALREFHARRAEAERLRGRVPGVSPAGGAR